MAKKKRIPVAVLEPESESDGYGSDDPVDSGDDEEGRLEVVADAGDDIVALGSSDSEEDSDQDEFEDQGSSSSDDSEGGGEEEEEEEGEDEALKLKVGGNIALEREYELERARRDGTLQRQQDLHMDVLSSDDEEGGNTIGNVPLRWYEEFDHIGYSVEGKKIMKRENAGDTIDAALDARDDPDYARTVYDKLNDKKVVLTDRQMEIIRRMQAGAFAHSEFEAYPEYVDYYSGVDKIKTSLGSAHEPKSRFVPSKWEAMTVQKILKGVREGRITLGPKKAKEETEEDLLIWRDDESDEGDARGKGPMHIPAPKLLPPGHAESYNPPKEFLPTDEEKAAWEAEDPSDRERNFLPTSYGALRSVPAYPQFIKERFERCLDLYLCPRAAKRRLNIDPESLVPKLPKPRELRPFPNTLSTQFLGHTARVRCLSISPDGQHLASGSEDCTVRLWETGTGRCVHTWELEAAVVALEWNPNRAHHVLAAAAGNSVALIATGTGGEDGTDVTNALLAAAEAEGKNGDDDGEDDEDDDGDGGGGGGGDGDAEEGEGKSGRTRKAKDFVRWSSTSANARRKRRRERSGKGDGGGDDGGGDVGVRVTLNLCAAATSIAWHKKGDYLATVTAAASDMPGGAAVLIHQISKRQSQMPFTKSKGQVQTVMFHPHKPFFFVATQTYVRVYHLVKQAMIKKLMSGAKWISSLDIHPSGDHVIMGSYDRRLCWFDLDLASTPYKTLKYHTKAVRQVKFHQRYPLVASASDDGTVHIFHATVYNDLMRNPMIVPLKILRGHKVTGGLGVMTIAFHPTQPWVFSGGADGSVRLFIDV